jgi:hypothetical protein
VAFVKALVFGKPPPEALEAPPDSALSRGFRVGLPGAVGSDKRFLYDIVANKQSGKKEEEVIVGLHSSIDSQGQIK